MPFHTIEIADVVLIVMLDAHRIHCHIAATRTSIWWQNGSSPCWTRSTTVDQFAHVAGLPMVHERPACAARERQLAGGPREEVLPQRTVKPPLGHWPNSSDSRSVSVTPAQLTAGRQRRDANPSHPPLAWRSNGIEAMGPAGQPDLA